MSIMLFIASCELILTCFLGPCRESDVAKLHPPPLNALAADESLRDEQYADSIYAKHYLALIQVGEDQFALVWASKKNYLRNKVLSCPTLSLSCAMVHSRQHLASQIIHIFIKF